MTDLGTWNLDDAYVGIVLSGFVSVVSLKVLIIKKCVGVGSQREHTTALQAPRRKPQQ